MIFRTLAILKDLMMVVIEPTLMLKTYKRIIPIQADKTIKKSKTFHPS